jgi:hypothetical protein
MTTIRYVGRRTKESVTVTRELDDGTSEPLPLRLDLAKKSPTGFEWGYNGSGPAQLALAILSDTVGDRRAVPNYQRFKFAVVGRLPQMGWILTQREVLDWFDREAKPEEADDYALAE